VPLWNREEPYRKSQPPKNMSLLRVWIWILKMTPSTLYLQTTSVCKMYKSYCYSLFSNLHRRLSDILSEIWSFSRLWPLPQPTKTLKPTRNVSPWSRIRAILKTMSPTKYVSAGHCNLQFLRRTGRGLMSAQLHPSPQYVEIRSASDHIPNRTPVLFHPV
jgi:hypothetical protein